MDRENELVTMAEMTALLDNVVVSKRCVRYWIGHANVLFIGIGQEIIPRPIVIERADGRRRYKHLSSAPYELQAMFADWRVEQSGVLLGESIDNDTCETGAAQLYGKTIIGWEWIFPGFGLQLEFEEALTLKITPYEPDSPDYVWNLRDMEKMYYFVRGTGIIFKRSGSLPYES